ncbi:YciI family protein [Luteolibacter flavescens]|uniref:YciI family protein n=1 Tax=Luteolibacter flavescens TaxID=1859460 RepID=A0ABT3FSI3_9BACT|nr:YciI family protein [Luteolibacter flavescens]MCW1886539.1 YciI family protein [Luteolibacter flavescens]
MSLDMSNPPQVTGHLLLFRQTDWASQGLSEDEIRQVMNRINAWFDGLASQGKILGAQPLMEAGVMISGETGGAVTDGPFVEAKESIGGYVLLSVTSMEEAVAIAKSNPMHEFGLTTEVRPTASTCPHLHRMLGSSLATATA